MSIAREELLGCVEAYLAALAANEPSRAPVTASARFTENGEALKLSDGLWATVTGRDTGGHCFTDPSTGQVAFFGVLSESQSPIILGLRLRVEGGRASEVESMVARPGGALFRPESITGPRPAFEEVMAPSKRSSREELIAITHSYFDGIEQRDGGIIRVDKDCARVENGMVTANRPADAAPLGGNEQMARLGAMGVAEQISAGIHGYISRVRDRRVLVVDEERGMTFGVFMFDHDGGDFIELKDGTRREMPAFARTPSTAMIWEAFKVRGGLIRHVEAIGRILPYGAKPGWPTGVGA